MKVFAAAMASVALLAPGILARTYIEKPSPTQMSYYSYQDCNNPTSVNEACCSLRAYFVNYTDGGGPRVWNDTSLYMESPGTFNVTADCYRRSNYNWLRVQAPGTPDHPYASPKTKVEIQDFDYIIKMGGGASESDCDTEYCDACDWEELGFGVVALALNGVGMFSPLSVEAADPFYPPDGYDEEDLDQCGGHPQASFVYHYHNAPVCVPGYTGQNDEEREYSIGNTACYDRSCSNDYVQEYYNGEGNYAGNSCGNKCVSPTGYAAGSANHPIGIALDGYVIYGPYNNSGEGISGLDNCNGKYVDGDYRYYATDTFPYLVGCFGPGRCDVTVDNLTCTNNAPISYCGQDPEPSKAPTVAPTEDCSDLWGKCGGSASYTGPTCCSGTSECYYKTANYAQCRPSCPDSWLCNGALDDDDATSAASIAAYSVLAVAVVVLGVVAGTFYYKYSQLLSAGAHHHHHHHHHHSKKSDGGVPQKGDVPNPAVCDGTEPLAQKPAGQIELAETSMPNKTEMA